MTLREIVVVLGLTTASLFGAWAQARDVSVRGYVRKDGTYVAPHVRSAPDGNFNNNWSTAGNINPYTGESGTLTTPSSGHSGFYSAPSYNLAPIPPSAAAAVAPGHRAASQPANAHVNVYGNGWECNRGFRRNRDACEAVVIPENGQLDVYGSGWVCQRGFRNTVQGCARVAIPEHAQLDVYGSGWVCQRGFRNTGQGCVSVTIPENAQLDVYGSGWVCQRGFRNTGEACARVGIPENAQLDVYGSGWVCQRGFRNTGVACVPVELPKNAQLDGYGSGWTCNRGYQRNGTQCTLIVLPENASLNYSANAWTCNAGFTRRGSGCVRSAGKAPPSTGGNAIVLVPSGVYGGYISGSYGSGHQAGYDWAEENGVEGPDDCGGNSNSFIEGCEEYAEEQVQERESYEEMDAE